MLQVRTCVSVHCHQCGDALGAPGFEAHYPSEDIALEAAAARGWRIGPGGQLYCSACGPVLTCEAEGHQFSPWHYPTLLGPYPALSEYRHCLRCYLFESRPAALVDHVGGGESR